MCVLQFLFGGGGGGEGCRVVGLGLRVWGLSIPAPAVLGYHRIWSCKYPQGLSQ